MQNRTKIFAACALPVMLGLSVLAGCEAQAPGAADSQLSIRQLNKSAAVKASDKVDNVVTPGVNKPGTGSVVIKIAGLAARKVLYSSADVRSIRVFLQHEDGVNDQDVTILTADLGDPLVLNNIPIGTYTPFLTAHDADNLGGNIISAGGAPVSGGADFIVTNGGTASPVLSLQLDATPVAMGNVNATINIIAGE